MSITMMMAQLIVAILTVSVIVPAGEHYMLARTNQVIYLFNRYPPLMVGFLFPSRENGRQAE